MEKFQETPFYSKAKKKLLALTRFAWNNKIDWQDVEAWLDNFNANDDLNECEKLQMLHLLDQFMYFGEREIKILLQCVFRDKFKYKIIHHIRKKRQNTLDREIIEKNFQNELMNTRFLGVGNPSESGTHLLYYFRQENKLPKNLFQHKDDIFETEHVIRDESENGPIIRKTERLANLEISNYVFLDDMCGSGVQASIYLKETVEKVKLLNPKAKIFYYVLFANSEGIKNIKSRVGLYIDYIDCVFELDNSFKCFGENSRHFKSTNEYIDRIKSQAISSKYGAMLLPNCPLGYDDNQLLIGFNHNTPDNTLPIIWFDEEGINWRPIFKRYNKIYGW
ncbi:hypothetical protein [Shewanella chilikensis]|uniref:phosphoribosyltransferase-like protein n=1 Tax=Shewanella chilikensis TaxID=558541 RepID=UPI001CD77B39|nr:hypothetical protein [Shewanella chilikensis]MCA0948670.1 hypothetical protein [Shewanella chilikensis]